MLRAVPPFFTTREKQIMSDFLTTYTTDFYAAAGAPSEPVTPSAADDSSERGALASAITAGDPVAISAAAREVITADLVQLGQQVIALREKTWHTRLMLAAVNSLPGVAPIPPEIVNAIRRTDEQEVPYAAHPAAADILQAYLVALKSDSTAVLS
jgi:hypothetical protein